MSAAIKSRVVQIGNSQGILIPKLLLEQSGIHTQVEIEVHNDHLIISAAPKLRVGWEEAFAAMTERNDDVLLDDVSTTDWDQVEWE
ncbi:AbrB/MazE/SpoVT family DNA-binding domain-containing protein [Nostoc sp. CENA67]|uniref:AbrB/MazE/SpoVT family DNA-binding domain-containing protein n=1 Tax=Amazonocrinis nigriterrae CENA67 TaxID=2794033 RepID=A0A8J7HSF4_9NOST|nr:AbrB/MazE/SpoVT family DNA-binding domain-containing protein [Amazonocrinis nigriterrae]MBH8564622.1 AbrB/MazE/SpoVT family DNA-binding domain-containing protein [Amazonocrinis nigriterrae CENA67]